MTPTVAAAWTRDGSQRRASQPHFYSQEERRNDNLLTSADRKILVQRAITPPARLLAPPSIDLYGPVSSC
jgi:hypothetical protein